MARRDSAKELEELAREFEDTRQRLDGTLSELAERTKPANIARRGLRQLRESGEGLLEDARALMSSQVVRSESHIVDPPEGTVIRGDEQQVETTYEVRPVPPGTVLVSVGVGVTVTVGLLLWWRRRRRG